MVSLIARVRMVIENAEEELMKNYGGYWNINKVAVIIKVNNDVDEIEFLNELDELLQKYGKEPDVIPITGEYSDVLSWLVSSP